MAGGNAEASAGTAAAPVAHGDYKAMVLSCIDPRMQERLHDYLRQEGLIGEVSQFVIAGAAIAAVAPAFADWHKAFWDNLAASIQMHRIEAVIAIDHRDCGGARIAYGEERLATPEKETETHRAAMAEFRAEVARRHPGLAVVTGLMALDGSITLFT